MFESGGRLVSSAIFFIMVANNQHLYGEEIGLKKVFMFSNVQFTSLTSTKYLSGLAGIVLAISAAQSVSSSEFVNVGNLDAERKKISVEIEKSFEGDGNKALVAKMTVVNDWDEAICISKYYLPGSAGLNQPRLTLLGPNDGEMNYKGKLASRLFPEILFIVVPPKSKFSTQLQLSNDFVFPNTIQKYTLRYLFPGVFCRVFDQGYPVFGFEMYVEEGEEEIVEMSAEDFIVFETGDISFEF